MKRTQQGRYEGLTEPEGTSPQPWEEDTTGQLLTKGRDREARPSYDNPSPDTYRKTHGRGTEPASARLERVWLMGCTLSFEEVPQLWWYTELSTRGRSGIDSVARWAHKSQQGKESDGPQEGG